jgi:uncharacterized membrane protein YedE/YeeE
MNRLIEFLVGLLFGFGLILSGMTDPGKVIGFLDVAGNWDPSLAFVMAGAIGVHFVAHRLVLRRTAPLFDDRFHMPTRRDIDPRLLGGAGLFGVGWGLGGYCPGPALVSAAAALLPALVFDAAMTAGMLLERAASKRSGRA